MSTPTGKVYLVGAGPGDPGLLTLRGKACLARADVVIHDALSNAILLDHAPEAEDIFVGKSKDSHTLLQEEINDLLIREAQKGRRVVRLKGGDPFVFGRGGEEALALAEAGVAFEVVPGVSSAHAVPTYAGIPITQRGISQSYTVLTGHRSPGEGQGLNPSDIPAEGTLVILMGVIHLADIAAELIAMGRAAATPAAVIEWGTYPKQRTVTATLETIAKRCEEEGIAAPAVIVIGEVATFHDTLNWYENRPLSGKRIVVTRARQQASAFARQLQELGADIFEFPTIKIEKPDHPEAMDYIGDYDWVILTSVNGVTMLFDRLEESGYDARDLSGVRLCVVGSATAEAVKQRFLRVDLMPEKYVAEELLEALVSMEESLEGKRFLLPRADIARSFLPKELRARGAEVTELIAYRTVRPDTPDALADAMVAYKPHLVTFTSSSTARNFAEMVGPERLAQVQHHAAFAAIGPIAAQTARDHAMPIAIEPDHHDIPSFVEAIVQWNGEA
jgi:uroporphyrinogen III methyltransferase/synthase